MKISEYSDDLLILMIGMYRDGKRSGHCEEEAIDDAVHVFRSLVKKTSVKEDGAAKEVVDELESRIDVLQEALSLAARRFRDTGQQDFHADAEKALVIAAKKLR